MIYTVQVINNLPDDYLTLEIAAMPDNLRIILDNGPGKSREVKTYSLEEAFKEAYKKLTKLEMQLNKN